MTVKYIAVTKENSGERLDKFLKREFFSYSRGEIIRNIRAGNILVNSKKVKSSYVLKEGDIIKSKIKNQKSKLISNSNIKFSVIYKNEDIIMINKPAGLSVHPVKSNENDTLANGLLAKFTEIKNIHDDSKNAHLRPGIIHRLDKDTSGVMVIARNMKAYEGLKKIFKERKVDKKYLAIVRGILKDKKGVIKKPIARAKTYRKQVIAGRKTKTKIREAITEYKVLKEFDNYSLLEVTPKTGRMHQIRVHLFSIGHPIVGDKLYKLKKAKLFPAKLSFKMTRQLLHAQQLIFDLGGKKYKFSARPPKDFADFLGFLDEGKIKS
ncbi:MAG: RluA family pseudouridine synthase [Candidatus Moranbacteria bacterium]|nr:RluA family pseudouridine synthase [Candidatus Moranbacteria bacterium]